MNADLPITRDNRYLVYDYAVQIGGQDKLAGHTYDQMLQLVNADHSHPLQEVFNYTSLPSPSDFENRPLVTLNLDDQDQFRSVRAYTNIL